MEIEDKYLTADSAKDGDIITFVDEGFKGDMKGRNGEVKKVNNFNVSNGSYTLVYTPNQTAIKVFVKAWGRDTKLWVNKKFQVKLVLLPMGKYMILPQIIEATP